jgi:hypothetical protein
MRIVALIAAFGIAFAVSAYGAPLQGPCADAFERGILCPKSGYAAQLIVERKVSGAFVIEDVRTGDVVFLSAYPEAPRNAVAAPILPLSVAKLFLAASLWDRQRGADDPTLDGRLNDVIVHSADAEGVRLAKALRARAGTTAVLGGLERYGIPFCAPATVDEKEAEFWGGDADADAREVFGPAKACTQLDEQTGDAAWGSAFSLGEANFSVTLLHLVRFIQAIGNDGVMVAPSVRSSGAAHDAREGRRVMSAATARKLKAAMREVVERGTARKVNERVRGGWRLAGKTGSSGIHGQPFDGIFVGLLSDPHGEARYAFAIYVEKGGLGGGAAAEIICDIFNYALGL